MKIYDEREKSYDERGNTPPTPVDTSSGGSGQNGSDTNSS